MLIAERYIKMCETQNKTKETQNMDSHMQTNKQKNVTETLPPKKKKKKKQKQKLKILLHT